MHSAQPGALLAGKGHSDQCITEPTAANLFLTAPWGEPRVLKSTVRNGHPEEQNPESHIIKNLNGYLQSEAQD